MSISSSRAGQQVRRIKEQAVLELYLREGSFCEAVIAMRAKWNITPTVGLPPEPLSTLQPGLNDDPFDERYGQWRSDVASLALLLGRGRFYRAADWEKFAEACVLYDPPPGRDKLAFAEYGGIIVRRADGRDVLGEGSEGEGLHTAAPLVRWVPNLAQRDLKTQRYYQGIIDGLAERYEAQTGKDAAEAIAEIICERGLEEQRRTALVDYAAAIFPDEHSDKDDVLAAYNAIRSNFGRKRVSGLVAVVCAELLDEHNANDSEDRRFKRFTHKKLASEFGSYGVDDERSAKYHAARGRELRAIRERNLEES